MDTASNSQSLVPERKRMKNARGVPVLYDEVKRTRSIALTDTALSAVQEFGKILGITSISQSVEAALRLVARLQASLERQDLQAVLNDHDDSQMDIKIVPRKPLNKSQTD